MKILVCVSKTPETTAKISFNSENTEFSGAGITFIMNPYDEWYALVRALDLAKATNGTVTLISVGGIDIEPVMRKGLALDANDGVRIDAQPVSSMFTAYQIAEYALSQKYDIIFTGKETIDYNGSEVGAMIAEYMNVPFISYATKLEISGTTATLARDIEGGEEELEVDLPVVVSAAKGMAEQRIASMMGIMKAKSKPILVMAPKPFNNPVHVDKFILPKAKAGVKYIAADNMDELVRLLHEDAKVI